MAIGLFYGVGIFLGIGIFFVGGFMTMSGAGWGASFGHRLRRHRGNPVHGVHAETAQRITEAPAFHAEGVKGGSSYGKTKADFKSEE